MKLGHTPIDEYFSNRLGSIFEYEQTKETFGIVALPIDITDKYDMIPAEIAPTASFSKSDLVELSLLPIVECDSIGSSSKDHMYRFLAKCQKTKIAVTAVHTEAEIELFNDFTQKDSSLKERIGISADSVKPNFEDFARIWSSFCEDNNKIYYKTPRHLESYYNIMEDRKKYGDSVLLNLEVVNEVRSTFNSESRFVASIPPNRQPTAASFIMEIPQQAAMISINQPVLLSQRLPQPRLLLPAPLNSLNTSSEDNPSKKRKRAPRTCAICGVAGCKGANNQSRCPKKNQTIIL